MTTGPGSSGATTLTAIVVNSTGDRTLRIVEDGALILPVVTVPERVSFPDVTVLLRALTDQHGIDAVALECLDRQESDHGPVELEALLELSPGSTIPAGAVWVTDLPARAALALARPAGHPATPAWSRPGWVTDALGWVTDRLVEAGQPLIRTPVQLRTWGLSAVFRCPTAGGPVYFKAAGHSSTIIPVGPEPRPLLFSHESRLLELLAHDDPDTFPAPIAVDHDRVWLLLPDLGQALESVAASDVWSAALRGHAQRQQRYVGQTDRLLDAGVVDRRLAVLDAEIDTLLGPNRITEPVDPVDRERLVTLGPAVHALVAGLAALGLPETLVHSDLHAHNVGVRGGQPTVFDWTDAAVAHPFLDLVTFFQHGWGITGDPAVVERLQSGYLQEWSGVTDAATLRQAYALAPRLAPVHQAVSYLHLVDSVSGVSREGCARAGVHWLGTLLRSAWGQGREFQRSRPGPSL